jgi:hypothetical protein
MGETLLSSGEILTIRDNSYSPSSFQNPELFPWPDVAVSATTLHERNVSSEPAFCSSADTGFVLDANLNIVDWIPNNRDEPTQSPSTDVASEDTISSQPSVRSQFKHALGRDSFIADIDNIDPSRPTTSPGFHQDPFLHVGELVDKADLPHAEQQLLRFLSHIPQAKIEGEDVPGDFPENSSFLKEDTLLFNTGTKIFLDLPQAEQSQEFEIGEFTPSILESLKTFSNPTIRRRTRRKFRPIERSNNKTGRKGKMRCERCRHHKQKGGFYLSVN